MIYSVKKEKKHISRFVPLVLLLLCIVFLWVFASRFSKDNTTRSKSALESALMRSITQCYALEGAYPANVEYLTEHYGLIYNEENFYIAYNYIGSNLRPDVTIIERD